MDARTLHHKIDFRSDAEIEKEQAVNWLHCDFASFFFYFFSL